MNTIVFNIDDKNKEHLKQVGSILQKGGLVAFPTETVYGLGANAFDEKAVKKIFIAKGRPSDNPLIVHIASMDQLKELVVSVPETAKKLMTAFWPGPLTLILRATDKVPQVVRAGLPSVGIRFPSHVVAQAVIKSAGLPIAAPSANTSGKPSPTNAKRVIEDLQGKVDGIIDAGEVNVGLESTVLDVTGKVPMILRPGGITKEMLEKVVGRVDVDPALSDLQDKVHKPKAPGMKYTHYSPDAQVIIVTGNYERITCKIQELVNIQRTNGKKVGVLATDQTINKYQADCVCSIGSRGNLEGVAKNLFETLRRFDDYKVDVVYAEAFENKGIGVAIMNRMEKSAGHNIIYV